MRLRISLCPADQERFGGPEWIVFDEDDLADVPIDTLERWEKPLLDTYGMSLLDMIAEATGGKVTMRSLRAMVWMAYQRAGVDIDYAEFNPRLMDPQLRAHEGDDAAPPAPTGDGPSSPASSVDPADAAQPEPTEPPAPSPAS